jgi:predicted DNA-binding protein (MmcQ/YjbR family)
MASKKKKNAAQDAALKELRAFGLAYPGAHTKSPWPGHLDLAVNEKTFGYLSIEGEPLSLSCKLPESAAAALMLSFTKPTGYGLGKSGWVTASFSEGDDVPVAMLKEWIDESYRAQAPKKLVASLGGPAGKSPTKEKKAGAAKASAKNAVARKTASGTASSKKASSKKASSRQAATKTSSSGAR